MVTKGGPWDAFEHSGRSDHGRPSPMRVLIMEDDVALKGMDIIEESIGEVEKEGGYA